MLFQAPYRVIKCFCSLHTEPYSVRDARIHICRTKEILTDNIDILCSGSEGMSFSFLSHITITNPEGQSLLLTYVTRYAKINHVSIQKSSIFLKKLYYHNSHSSYANKTQFLPQMQNLMENLLKLTECKYIF